MPSATGSPSTVEVTALPALKPDLYERAWCSVPHPTLPLLATAHGKSVTVFSLTSLSSHSTLTGGHARSVRSVSWKPNLPPHQLCLVTGSFDSTAGVWRWDGELPFTDPDSAAAAAAAAAPRLETDITTATSSTAGRRPVATRDSDDSDAEDKDWEFTLVLEGHDSEIKSAAFSPSGAHLATCSRDQTVWVWEDVGATEGDDEWETVAVLNEHDGDMKSLAWCPDVPGRNARRGVYGSDVLASASYDDTVRVWREDGDGEWVCVAVLEGHEGTVWGLQWEGRPRDDGKFPRLLSFSADRTIRIWSLRQDHNDNEDDAAPAVGAPSGLGSSAFGGIPNTMRQSLREDWYCSDVLPVAHTRDIYSAAWSAKTGLVASTGSDGLVAVYGEDSAHENEGEAAAADPSSSAVTNGAGRTSATDANTSCGIVEAPGGSSKWRLLTTVSNAHGPYEINHVTWCRRWDGQADRQTKGEEEMLVTTGDEGLVRPWKVSVV